MFLLESEGKEYTAAPQVIPTQEESKDVKDSIGSNAGTSSKTGFKAPSDISGAQTSSEVSIRSQH